MFRKFKLKTKLVLGSMAMVIAGLLEAGTVLPTSKISNTTARTLKADVPIGPQAIVCFAMQDVVS